MDGRKVLAALFVSLLFSGSTALGAISVGSGPNTSHLWVNFKDGAAYDFAISYDGMKTGWELFDIIEANSTLKTARGEYAFGTMLEGISFDGHYNGAYEGGSDWWHRWVLDDTQNWVWGMGASSRTASNGSYDAYVYGRDSLPIPEPGSLAVLGATTMLLLRRGRKSPLSGRGRVERRNADTPVSRMKLAGTSRGCTLIPISLREGEGAQRRRTAALLAVLLLASPAAFGSYVYNASDFATEVHDYTPGSGIPLDFISNTPFNDPPAALGRPTIDTSADPFTMDPAERVPVVPIYGPFRSTELVTVGKGGQLTLKFSRPVYDNPGNPYGIDFTIFGNSVLYVGADQSWLNRDPAGTSAGTLFGPEGAMVYVSQDAQAWVPFANGPMADSFAPTLGRVLDPLHPDKSVGAYNEWWGEPTNPTLPLDPAITIDDLKNRTVAQLATLYGESAGGTGFDLGDVGMDWIQYVRIVNPADSRVTPDIDAVAIVSAVPEPGAIGLLALAGLALLRRTKR